MEQNTHVFGICGRIRPQTNVHLFTLQGGGERCGVKTSPSIFAHTFQGLALFQGLNQANTCFGGTWLKKSVHKTQIFKKKFYFRPFPATVL